MGRLVWLDLFIYLREAGPNGPLEDSTYKLCLRLIRAVLLKNARVVRGKWGLMKAAIVEGGGAA